MAAVRHRQIEIDGAAENLALPVVPVMLGPVDRVGYDGRPLKIQAVSEYEATVTHLYGSSTYSAGDYAITVPREAVHGDFYDEAERATAGFPPGEADIRLDEIKPQAYGLVGGAKMKARVDVHGTIVRVMAGGQ